MKAANKPENIAILRQKAEALLKRETTKKGFQTPEIDAVRLLHELEVYQIELELQNEELFMANQKAAELATEKYAELYDFAPTGYFTLSKGGYIIELNICGSQMLGKERKYLKNSRFELFVSDDTKLIFNRFITNIFSGKTKDFCELIFTGDDDLLSYVQLNGVATQNGEQCLVTAVDITDRKLAENCLLQDLAERKQVDAEIQLKNEELLKINAEKDKFFSIIAHDLRSPLSGFLGLTEIMADGFPDMSQEEFHELALTMKNSATHLFHLLSNLLEWSRMQRGLTTFVPESFPLSPRIYECVMSILEAANKKDIAITYDIPDDLAVIADGNMFEVILRNLVSNAVKFTPKGGCITISAKSGAGNPIEISIKDNGIGMNKNMIDNLFRLDINTNRKGTEGEYTTGLGLIICKDFIEKHGGKLWVESEEGKGSIFRFTII